MALRRPLRRFVASLLMLCVLLAQTAAIAYACPRDAAASAEAAMPCGVHLATAAEDDAGALPEGNVCEVHCQAFTVPGAGAPVMPLLAPVIAWHLPRALPAAAAAGPVAELEARSAAPPPLALFARLLI